jgi:hypothetical protein
MVGFWLIVVLVARVAASFLRSWIKLGQLEQ